jgi:hypothetical protein
MLARPRISTQAEGRWWSAAARWAAAAKASRWEADAGAASGADNPSIESYKASAAALLRVRVGPGVCSQAERDGMEYRVIMSILTQWDPRDLEAYKPRLEALMSSDAARADVMGRVNFIVMTDHYPCCMAGEWAGAGRAMVKAMLLLLAGAHDAVDPETRSYQLIISGQGLIWFSHAPLTNASEYDELYGDAGRLLMEAMQSYDVAGDVFVAILDFFNFDVFGRYLPLQFSTYPCCWIMCWIRIVNSTCSVAVQSPCFHYCYIGGTLPRPTRSSTLPPPIFRLCLQKAYSTRNEQLRPSFL